MQILGLFAHLLDALTVQICSGLRGFRQILQEGANICQNNVVFTSILRPMHCTKAARAMPLQLAVRRTKLMMGNVPQLPSSAHVHIN